MKKRKILSPVCFIMPGLILNLSYGANKETGFSPHFWERAIGWYMMALGDVLDFVSKNHPKRNIFINQLKEMSEVLLKFRDQKLKVWYQIFDLPDKRQIILKHLFPQCSLILLPKMLIKDT